MKTQLMTSTCALIVGLYGLTPAVASFENRGADWTVNRSMPTAANPRQSPPPAADGSFASSWGSGKTPTQYEGSSSSLVGLATGQSCDLMPKVGFNDDNNFQTC